MIDEKKNSERNFWEIERPDFLLDIFIELNLSRRTQKGVPQIQLLNDEITHL